MNVNWISRYYHEEERLIMGSTLRIYDIYIGGKSMRKYGYVQAINLFERIMTGKGKINENAHVQRVYMECW